MTLDEAIKRYINNAEYERIHGSLQGCLDFRQLAEWLKDYKRLLEQEPCDTVSRGVFEQVMYERDIAIEQLHELGYEWGQKIEPCSDSISRQAVLNCFKKWQPYMATRIWDFEKELSALPSVTQKPVECYQQGYIDGVNQMVKESKVEQKSGMWIEHPEIKTSTPEYLMFYECSECGDKQCFCKSDIHKKHFCNNCGAKMESEE